MSAEGFYQIFSCLFAKKIQKNVSACFYEIINPLQIIWRGKFDPDISYRNPPVVWNIITQAAKDMYNYADFFCIQWGVEAGGNRPMTEIMIRVVT